MSIFGLLGFYSKARTYVSPDGDALEEAGENAPKHASFHRVIVAVSCVCGVIGGCLGVALVIGYVLLLQSEPGRRFDFRILLVPLALAAFGHFLGVAMACAFAPQTFLTGPLGRKWMKLIGTKSPLLARIVCFLLPMLTIAIVAGVACLIVFNPR
jgi:ABC-type Fe3+ transport system permease subunit